MRSAQAARRTAETTANDRRHQLLVVTYEHSNLRATLARVETARQRVTEQLGHAQAHIDDTEARVRQAVVERDRCRSDLATLQASRAWRWLRRLTAPVRRLAAWGRPA